MLSQLRGQSDFPWSSIGTGTVVDIGGGVGELSPPLSTQKCGNLTGPMLLRELLA